MRFELDRKLLTGYDLDGPRNWRFKKVCSVISVEPQNNFSVFRIEILILRERSILVRFLR